MAEVSFVATFLGGVLALLSPCSALLVPIFFANAFTGRVALLGNTVLFYLGLCTMLVPLGLGASLLSAAIIDHRETTILVAGVVLIVFGLLEMSGRGLRIAPDALVSRVRLQRSGLAVFSTGLVYGIAGFCSGPLLGAVLAIAASTANPALGASLLAVYSLGIAAPLFAIAWAWDRYGLARRSWLRGSAIRLGPWEFHSTNLIAGSLFVLLGVSFIAFQGGGALSGLYADVGLEEAGFVIQDWVSANVTAGLDIALVGGVLILAAVLLLRRLRRTARSAPEARRP